LPQTIVLKKHQINGFGLVVFRVSRTGVSGILLFQSSLLLMRSISACEIDMPIRFCFNVFDKCVKNIVIVRIHRFQLHQSIGVMPCHKKRKKDVFDAEINKEKYENKDGETI
jgi:hypothetical protein